MLLKIVWNTINSKTVRKFSQRIYCTKPTYPTAMNKDIVQQAVEQRTRELAELVIDIKWKKIHQELLRVISIEVKKEADKAQKLRDMRARIAAKNRQEFYEQMESRTRLVVLIFKYNYSRMHSYSINELRILCPKVYFPENDNIYEWCLFCLGSKLCAEIYKNFYEEPSEEIVGNNPNCSIIFHLDDKTVCKILEYLLRWSNVVGIQELIGFWFVKMLQRCKKPLDKRTKEVLEAIYKYCEHRIASLRFYDLEEPLLMIIPELLVETFGF